MRSSAIWQHPSRPLSVPIQSHFRIDVTDCGTINGIDIGENLFSPIAVMTFRNCFSQDLYIMVINSYFQSFYSLWSQRLITEKRSCCSEGQHRSNGLARRKHRRLITEVKLPWTKLAFRIAEHLASLSTLVSLITTIRDNDYSTRCRFIAEKGKEIYFFLIMQFKNNLSNLTIFIVRMKDVIFWLLFRIIFEGPKVYMQRTLSGCAIVAAYRCQSTRPILFKLLWKCQTEYVRIPRRIDVKSIDVIFYPKSVDKNEKSRNRWSFCTLVPSSKD